MDTKKSMKKIAPKRRRVRSDKGKGHGLPSRVMGGPNEDRGTYTGVLATLTIRVDPRTREILYRLGRGSCGLGCRLLARAYGTVMLAAAVKERAPKGA